MLKFLRRKRTKFTTIRAEDLKVGDRLIFGQVSVEVKAIAKTPQSVILDVDTTDHPGVDDKSKTVSVRRELLITVPR